MTTLPTKQNKKLGLVIDLDICVGCHACAVNCKEWNTSGHSSPLHDIDCLLYTSPSPRDLSTSRMPSSA